MHVFGNYKQVLNLKQRGKSPAPDISSPSATPTLTSIPM